jgi:dihydroneopterin aldolase
VGVYDWEHGRVQTLRFDLTLDVDAAAASRTDALADTLDYAAVADAIEAELARGHVRLVETVAERVAAMLLQRFALRGCSVRVTKPDVPRPGAQAIVEVRRGHG